MAKSLPAWIPRAAAACAEIEVGAGRYLADATGDASVDPRDVRDMEAFVRMAKGMRRKFEAWQRRASVSHKTRVDGLVSQEPSCVPDIKRSEG